MGNVKENKKNKLTQLYFLIDSSGSMSSIKKAMESGFSEFIDAQKKNKIDDMFVTLTTFAYDFKTVYSNKNIDNVESITIEPHGGTALYDAISSLFGIIEETKKKDSNIIICIVTDGEENSSKKKNVNDIKKLISEAGEKGYIVEYMGANQDAVLAGGNIGISFNKSLTYQPNSGSVDNLWKKMGESVSYTRSTCVSYDYTEKDRADLVS